MLFFGHKTSMEIHIREATIADLPAITDLAIEAATQIPGFRYRYPYSRLYPQDTYHFTWREYETYIRDTDDLWKWKTMVAEISEDGQTRKVVAVAVWEVSVLEGQEKLELERGQLSNVEESLSSGQDLSPNEPESNLKLPIQIRRDENPAHFKAWKETLDNARRKYLEPNGPVNGPLSYLHLQELHTHPEYQYNGAGTALARWGMRLAKKHYIKIGLFASPMGEILHRKLHFKTLANIVVQVQGETSRVMVSCMALAAPET